MQSFTKIELEWTAQELEKAARRLERYGAMSATDVERGLSSLRAEQLRSIAEKLAKAAADGDKRISIR